MANNTKQNPDSHSNDEGQQHTIMSELVAAARIFYDTLEIIRSTPVVAGFRGAANQFILALPAVRTAEADPIVVERLKEILHRRNCDSVTFIHPVDIEVIGHRDESAEPSGGQGLLLEVQTRGRPTLMRMMLLNRRDAGKNFFHPPVPVTGVAFGVTYPDLLDDRTA